MPTLNATMIAIQAPPVMPIDLTAMVAVIMGLLVVLIPISGLTARFALKPIAEAVARMREAQGTAREVDVLEQRVALLERQISTMETDIERLEATSEFDRQLRSGE